MVATREDWDQSEKGRRAEPELGPRVMRAAEGEQNLPGVGGAESVGLRCPQIGSSALWSARMGSGDLPTLPDWLLLGGCFSSSKTQPGKPSPVTQAEGAPPS